MRQVTEIRLELRDLKKIIEGKVVPRESQDFVVNQCDDLADFIRLEEKAKSDIDYAGKLVCSDYSIRI